MKVFLIVIAVLFAIFALILSLSAEFTIIYENGWTTRVRVLFIEKDIKLGKILSFILFPEKAAKDLAEQKKEEEKKKEEAMPKEEKAEKKPAKDSSAPKLEQVERVEAEEEKQEIKQEQNQAKKSPISKILDEEGVLGIMLLVSNLLQTAGAAVSTLIKGLHIYSLYVKMIIGGGDAADIGMFYGTVCGYYYPIKGMILNGMKVDQYDDLIMPDFIAPFSEYEFQFIGSINIALLLKVVLKAVKVFLVNFIKNK